MSTTKEYRIRELERQVSRKAARLNSLEAGADRAINAILSLRQYTENWDGTSGSTCSGNVTINASCNGTGSVMASASVVATDGVHTVTGTTGAGGQFTFAPSYTGAWTFTVTKAGFATYTGSFTFSCANLSVAAPMVTSSNTISGTTRCDGVTALTGVPITIRSSPSGTILGTTTSGAGGAWSVTVSGYSTHSFTITYGAVTGYADRTSGVLTMSCTGTTATGVSGPSVAPGKASQCTPCLVADATTLTWSSSGYSVTLTYDGPGFGAYVGYLTVNCRSITGSGCSKGTAAVTLMIRYRSSDCACFVTFKRAGLSSPTCTATIGGFSGRDIPTSDAWCATLSGSGGLGQCTEIQFYGNGTHSFSSATGYPYVATYTGVLLYDADGNAFLTNATVSE